MFRDIRLYAYITIALNGCADRFLQRGLLKHEDVFGADLTANIFLERT